MYTKGEEWHIEFVKPPLHQVRRLEIWSGDPNAGGTFICGVDEHSQEDFHNMHLMKLAPELYEALKTLASICRDVSYTHSELKQARQALTKAEGGE